MRTKEVVEIPSIYNKLPRVTHVDPELRMNYEKILDKPFLVTTINWSTTAPNFTELWRLPFPSCIMSNPLTRVPFEASTFFQAKMCCMLQVSGTPMHQGLILVAAVPTGVPVVTNPNQILSAPHVFLNATESTSVCLECPMYTPSTLYRTQAPNAGDNNKVIPSSYFGTDVFDLVFLVMDALTVATGSSTTISISVHNIFKEAQFYVPKVGAMTWQAQSKEKLLEENSSVFQPEGFLSSLWKIPTKILDDTASGLKVVAGDLIDYGRGMIKELTGFHNPTVPNIDGRMLATFRTFPNNVDQPIHLEVLDTHAQFSRVYDDYYFRTEQDEMDLKFLTSKPVFVGKFSVLSTDVTGRNLFAYPMTPMVEATAVAGFANTTYHSPLRTIYEASRQWRGGLKMHIQAVCTNFHFCKIIVLKNYATTDASINSASAVVPAYSNIHNLNTDTLEFSAGGQIQTIDLPFNSYLRQLECTKDFAYNAISHGVAYGYLVQPLTYNSNVPTSVTFNVYISGAEDLEFSGYALDPINIKEGPPPSYPGVPNFYANELGIYEINKDGSHSGRILDTKALEQDLLDERKSKFFSEKPTLYPVEEGDRWEDVSFITSVPLETLRNLNAATHNSSSKYYNIKKGPKLNAGDKLIYQPCDVGEIVESNSYFQAESMETAEGTNALITPNTQEPLLNKIVSSDENIKMSFRPNTSVRDYMRFMYPQTTVAITPTTTKNVVAFDLNLLVKKFVNADMFHAFHSLYMGMSGGLKLKFKISGVSNAGAMFVPPSSHCINNLYLRRYPMSNAVPTDPNALVSFLAGMTYDPTVKSYTAPQIEMQDYTRPHNSGGTTVKGRPGSSFVLEMAIPNMNPFNFVGNALKWYATANDPENDLGVVYINYDASFDGTDYSPVNIIPFIGLNDEARLGFQVFAPEKTILTYTNSAPSIVCRNSVLHPLTIGTVYPNGLPINRMPMIGSSYYFR